MTCSSKKINRTNAVSVTVYNFQYDIDFKSESVIWLQVAIAALVLGIDITQTVLKTNWIVVIGKPICQLSDFWVVDNTFDE